MVWDEVKDKIKAEYIAGGTSYRKLAEKYEVSKTTLQKNATREKWGELRSQAEAKKTSKIINSVSSEGVKIDKKYYSAVNKLLDKAVKTIENTSAWTPNTLKEMATALKYIKECKGVKSAADRREQEARIANLEKQVESGADNLNEISIVFKAGPEEWNE